MSDPEDKLFYVGQKAFIEKDGKLLILNDPVLGLDFPGGKIQEGETDLDKALKREVCEETGLEIEVGDPFVRWIYKLHPGHRNAGKEIYIVGFKCKYVSGAVTLSFEHDKFFWVTKDNFRDLDQTNEYFKILETYYQGS